MWSQPDVFECPRRTEKMRIPQCSWACCFHNQTWSSCGKVWKCLLNYWGTKFLRGSSTINYIYHSWLKNCIFFISMCKFWGCSSLHQTTCGHKLCRPTFIRYVMFWLILSTKPNQHVTISNFTTFVIVTTEVNWDRVTTLTTFVLFTSFSIILI